MLSRSDFKTVISLTVHKSISRNMGLWLEIDFRPVYWEGYYGTGIVQLRNVKCFRKKFLLDGKAAKAHERNFYECPFE